MVCQLPFLQTVCHSKSSSVLIGLNAPELRPQCFSRPSLFPRCEFPGQNCLNCLSRSALSVSDGVLLRRSGFTADMKRNHNYSSSESDLDDNVEVEKDSGDENG